MHSLKEQLAGAFPWLKHETEEDDEDISGSDVIDQLQQLYDNLPADNIDLPTKHAHGIVGLTIGTDQQFLNAAASTQRAYWDAIVDLNCALGTKFDASDAPSLEGVTVEQLRDGTING